MEECSKFMDDDFFLEIVCMDFVELFNILDRWFEYFIVFGFLDFFSFLDLFWVLIMVDKIFVYRYDEVDELWEINLYVKE